MDFNNVAVALLLLILLGFVVFWFRRKKIPRECRNCIHWDLEEGQEAVRQFPPFLLAAQHISMAQMSQPIVGHDEDDNPIFGPAPVPAKAKWEHVGACMCETPSCRDEDGSPVLRWAGDTCGEFKRTREKRALPVVREAAPAAQGGS